MRIAIAFGPDVVHLASPFVLGASGLAAAQQLGIPSVAVYQTDMPSYLSQHGPGVAGRTAGHADWRWLCGPARAGEGGRPPRRAGRPRGCPPGPGRRGPVTSVTGRAAPGASFLGQLEGVDLAHAYAALDVFVHTGTRETFGQTLQEAAATGLPVVAPARGGPLDLVQHGSTGLLFDPDLPGDPLRQVSQLTDGPTAPEHRTRMSAAGRAAVRDRSWPALVDELLGHYTVAAAQRTARRTA